MKHEPQGITIKNPNLSSSAEKIKDEADYVNFTVNKEDKKEATTDSTFVFWTSLVLPVALCWVTLILIMSLRFHYTTVILENSTKFQAENQELKTQKENLTEQMKTMETKWKELNLHATIVMLENTNLTEENQDLKTQRKNLTQQIRDMEAKWIKDNVTRAQWSIDSYCSKIDTGRKCNACLSGWLNSTSSCYAINDAPVSDWKTWEEARENCRGKISDLTVIVNEAEKKFITENSWNKSGIIGYWIGLKVEDGRWKWVDGSELTNNLWIEPAVNGRCATSFKDTGWKSVNCTERNAWICEKTGLTL